ncbi:MAG: hypothetical protein JXB30_01600 [Anaerolineae bacterium]|nr:hypothetical protein [Anaerolineae bacterium]
MRKQICRLAAVLLSVLVLAACNMPAFRQRSTLVPVPGLCGDGICEGPEDAEVCPEDCPAAEDIDNIVGEEDAYWIDNPTSGARLYMKAVHPQAWSGEALPALVLIPGGSDDSSKFLRGQAQTMADSGFVIVVFDADGRGRSEGEEDYNGFTHQDGLAAVIQQVAALPEVNPSLIGLVSYSYGITMASGVLARHTDLPVLFLIDWEGPAGRNDTGGCDEHQTGHLTGKAACDDEAFWAEREAMTFISQIKVPYQRLQTESDHAQPDNNHAIAMVNAAVNGGVTWVRLNDLEPNQTFDAANPPPMLSEETDRQLEVLVVRHAQELLLSLE